MNAPALGRRWAFRDEAARGWVVWSFLAPIWAIGFLVIFGSLGAIAVAAAMRAGGMELDPTAPDTLAALLIAGFAPVAAVILVYAAVVERRSLASIGFGGPRSAARFAAGLLSGAAYVAAVVALIFALGGVEAVAIAPAWERPGQLAWIAALFVAFIVQGGTEEVVFRGWLMSALAVRRGLVVAVAVNAVVFGLLHALNISPVNWVAIANVGVMGLFVSLMALNDGSIWRACGWHAAWNWALLTGFEIEMSGMPPTVAALAVDLDRAGADLISGGAFGPEGSLVTTAALLAGTMWNAAALYRRRGAKSDITI